MKNEHELQNVVFFFGMSPSSYNRPKISLIFFCSFDFQGEISTGYVLFMTFLLIGCWMNPGSLHSQMNLALNLSVESNSPTASKFWPLFPIIHVKSLSLNYRQTEMSILKVAIDLLHFSLILRLNFQEELKLLIFQY